jgi:dTDP-4-dehydrorhamnose reductase
MVQPVLIIGRKGQLATDLAAMASCGQPLACLGRPGLDLTDKDSIARAIDRHQPAAIINAAAYTAVDKAESEPEAAFALNRDGPALLAALCARHAIALVHVSTDQVFGDDRAVPHAEHDKPDPLCTYGRSKLAGERHVLEAGGQALIARVSWVFGPSGDNFVTKVLGWAKARPELSIVADQMGRPTYSPELAALLLRLAANMAAGKTSPTRVLHLAGADIMSRADQARAILAASRARGGPFAVVKGVPTSAFPTPAKRPLNAVLDVSLAQTRHGLALGAFVPALEATLDHLIGPRTS